MTDAILVFLFNFVNDWLIVKYIRGVTSQDKYIAGAVSAIIVGLSLLSIYFIINEIWLIGFAMLGAGLGTWWGLRG